tara:strand:+ start:675 stop:1103 length:429 start_codon:yes stop_codon:yes gene_type:complete
MTTLYKKIKLFNKDGKPKIYTDTTSLRRVLTPRVTLNRINKITGLKTSRNLKNAKTNDEREYVREIARYFMAIGKFSNAEKLMKSMNRGERRKLFSELSTSQLIEYFVKIAGPLARKYGSKMRKAELVNMAMNIRPSKRRRT